MSAGDDFAAKEQAYYAHMERFILVHRKHAGEQQAAMLIELERVERWAKIFGSGAAHSGPPALFMIEDSARRRGLAI